ncbi:unnamed protein product [Moneuplotes crassus]|uniref:Uncharacterized protein n=1 Tax=Euplotes crassus TaxID=5936 RepID=A0AAD1U7T8_EUPCR|nr:unnamed protein product [Moneuplotes crassus]
MDRQDTFSRKAALMALSENLKSAETIDCIVAGIIISKDYSKTLSVLECISNCRKYAEKYSLKDEGKLLLYRDKIMEMRNKSEAMNRAKNCFEGSKDTSQLPEKKREMKAKEKQIEEAQASLPDLSSRERQNSSSEEENGEPKSLVIPRKQRLDSNGKVITENDIKLENVEKKMNDTSEKEMNGNEGVNPEKKSSQEIDSETAKIEEKEPESNQSQQSNQDSSAQEENSNKEKDDKERVDGEEKKDNEESKEEHEEAKSEQSLPENVIPLKQVLNPQINTPTAPGMKKVKRKERKKKPRKKTSEQVQSKTELWSWEKLLSQKDKFKKTSINSLPSLEGFNTCKICHSNIQNDSCIVNTICMHIYHLKCLIIQCQRYLAKSQYPEDCPARLCNKRLGPQEITKHLESNDRIRYEAFSLLRSGQMNRKHLIWCYNCRLIYAQPHSRSKEANEDSKESDPHSKSIQNLKCPKCSGVSYGFQDALKFLEIAGKKNKVTDEQYNERKTLDKSFLADCRKVVLRCTKCWKRTKRIPNYNYQLCNCKKEEHVIDLEE